ncbi:MAG: hypothetical protein P4M15_15140 [Alphaproteobacteria bacterium]|nr:hypothetical protein [Alphaproteobacteria bacterium]
MDSEDRKWADGVNALHAAHIPFDPLSREHRIGFAEVILSGSAKEVLNEITGNGTSKNPVVRAIVDNKLGGALLGEKDDVLKIAAPTREQLEHAVAVLAKTPQVTSALILGS